MYLQEFKFSVQHRAQMKNVDALSRLTCFLIEDSTKYRLGEAQNKDEWIKAVKTVLDNAESYEDFFVRNNILYKDVAKELLVVPESMHGKIIGIVHREIHYGIKKTRELVEKCYYIQNIQDKVKRFVKSCVECLIIDSKRGKKEGLLTPF